ncbi:MAG: glycoside hydrolase family 13 protein [Actinobacteria bacterium]|nr:glycoside hydrolase family 13 protein [Actinomycetota bacterium]
MTGAEWWRHAVIYQIYPRSFADGNGDGIGDLRGIIDHLDYIDSLGVDGIWLGPVMSSPQADHGYDVADYRDIDPIFGTLADMDDLIAACHQRGLKITLDFVPNHTSEAHPWFQAALAAGPGSPERDRYLFRPGRGEHGELPPNNWRSVFGGPSWTRVIESDGTPGEWYYHLFAPEQPDLNWRNPDVLPEFSDVLRFWLRRGIDGFRIDVSDAPMKDPGFPDTADEQPLIPKDEASGVHDIYRAFRTVFDSFDGDRMAVVETGAPAEIVALFLRPDEMNLAFNFSFTRSPWDADAIRDAITSALAANDAVGAPTTWVTDNHDMPRSVSRYGTSLRLVGEYVPALDQQAEVDVALGIRRHRAMALLMCALPGTVYLYNGQELGLPNVDDLPEAVLQDPVWERSGHTERGRDGCRVPMPWSGDEPPYGFSTNRQTWLPMPQGWGHYTVENEDADAESMLMLYRRALSLRAIHPGLGRGAIRWLEAADAVLALEVASELEPVVVVVNTGGTPAPLPAEIPVGITILSSDPTVPTGSNVVEIPADATVWLRRP